MTRWAGLFVILSLLCTTGHAGPWAFSDPEDVSRSHGARVFHHLGSGGRNGIAISGSRVGVVWEDNRDGVSRCYLAVAEQASRGFTTEHRISGQGPCYEPAITGLGGGSFAVGWEETGAVWARVLGPGGLSPGARLAGPAAAHVALAENPDGGARAVWSQVVGRWSQVWIGDLRMSSSGAAPILANSRPVEPGDPKGDQTYPAVAAMPGGRLLVGWEDRRKGHTVIMATVSHTERAFAPPAQINESFWGGKALGYGRGTGAMRVSLAVLPGGEVIAVWADKREYRSGYDVYASRRRGGEPAAGFGANEKVQDGFADGVGQWHPSVAAGPEDRKAVVVWDDDRDGDPNVWISWLEEDGWSDDLDPPGASGPGAQVEPAIAMDPHGNLHLAWVDRDDLNSPSRIRYLFGRRQPQPK